MDEQKRRSWGRKKSTKEELDTLAPVGSNNSSPGQEARTSSPDDGKDDAGRKKSGTTPLGRAQSAEQKKKGLFSRLLWSGDGGGGEGSEEAASGGESPVLVAEEDRERTLKSIVTKIAKSPRSRTKDSAAKDSLGTPNVPSISTVDASLGSVMLVSEEHAGISLSGTCSPYGSPPQSPRHGSPPGSPRQPLLGRPPQGPVAPQLKSSRRHAVVEVADMAKWNRDKSRSSLPVGLVGLVEEESIVLLFDDESLLARNKMVRSLLDAQRRLIEESSMSALPPTVSSNTSSIQPVTQMDNQRDSRALEMNQQLEAEFERFTKECDDHLQEEVRKTQRAVLRGDALEAELEKVRAELDFVKQCLDMSRRVCLVCRTAEADTVVQPCCHLCVCSDCIRFQATCPACSAPAKSIVEIVKH